MIVEVNEETKTLAVIQELTYFNQSNDTLTYVVLNDWLNAYSNRKTPMAKRFSDEFERAFYLAKEKELGKTNNIAIFDENNKPLTWERNSKHPDNIHILLQKNVFPNEKSLIKLRYTLKIPNADFTKFGYEKEGRMNLKNFFLTPTRFENHQFIKYENLNLDDASNAISDYDIQIKIPNYLYLSSDLNEISIENLNDSKYYTLKGKNRLTVNLFIANKNDFEIYRNSKIEVVTNFEDNRLTEVQKAILIDKITTYVDENIGEYLHKKIIVSQADYERNPFYGLNQLPIFVSPFPDQFQFEIKFLKTYLNNFLHTSLHLDPRKDNWIFDGIQIYTMMNYIEKYHPEAKMIGNVSKLKLLKGFRLINLNFNEQYSYFYMLMARKNLDQPLGNPKNTLIRFNEKIASKYRAGLSLKYLDSYLGNDIVVNSIKSFYELNINQQTNLNDFEAILKSNSPKNLNWFFNTIINSRKKIDYKFKTVTKTKDTVFFSIKNNTVPQVPFPVFGIKGKEIVFKKWLDVINKDSIYAFPRLGAEKIVINYKNEVPEYNTRNNWHSLKGFRLNNRPIKFNFMKDLEDPFYNQILYVPTLEYNYYDGFYLGMRFHNRTILDKPFIYDLNPTFSTNTKNLSGKGQFSINQYNRDNNLYYIRYYIGGHYLHYAPDAYYKKINPSIQFYFRPDDLRNNRKSVIEIKETIVNKEKSAIVNNDNYNNFEIFSLNYITSKTEVTRHFSFYTNFQYDNNFSKINLEIEYRKLLKNDRMLGTRFFLGTFLHNITKTNYFDYAIDRPTDYLFESDYLGRSETSGLLSQQSIIADGFFKSIFKTRTANQWLTTVNLNYNLWNWVDIYGDVGLFKNKNVNPKFIYDSGIRLNLVTDYFELYFPVYSNNGWEFSEGKYSEKIRFIVTFSPNKLINLFTRKWF